MAEQSPEQIARSQLREFRQVVANVVGELRGQELKDSYSALTLLELCSQQITNLSSTGTRPGRLERLTRVRDEYLSKIEGLKSTPPSSFRTPDASTDVNTAP